jgi:hypothetical protein
MLGVATPLEQTWIKTIQENQSPFNKIIWTMRILEMGLLRADFYKANNNPEATRKTNTGKKKEKRKTKDLGFPDNISLHQLLQNKPNQNQIDSLIK